MSVVVSIMVLDHSRIIGDVNEVSFMEPSEEVLDMIQLQL